MQSVAKHPTFFACMVHQGCMMVMLATSMNGVSMASALSARAGLGMQDLILFQHMRTRRIVSPSCSISSKLRKSPLFMAFLVGGRPRFSLRKGIRSGVMFCWLIVLVLGCLYTLGLLLSMINQLRMKWLRSSMLDVQNIKIQRTVCKATYKAVQTIIQLRSKKQ